VPRRPESEPSPYAKAATTAIRRLLADRRLAAADIARGTDLSANYLGERLRDEKAFTLSDIEQIAAFFDLDPAAFLVEVARAHADDVGTDGDTAGIDELGVLTGRELSQRDLDLAALKDTKGSANDGDDAGPGA
jgi:transcriptional regulator with XRE-family HTH domain